MEDHNINRYDAHGLNILSASMDRESVYFEVRDGEKYITKAAMYFDITYTVFASYLDRRADIGDKRRFLICFGSRDSDPSAEEMVLQRSATSEKLRKFIANKSSSDTVFAAMYNTANTHFKDVISELL